MSNVGVDNTVRPIKKPRLESDPTLDHQTAIDALVRYENGINDTSFLRFEALSVIFPFSDERQQWISATAVENVIVLCVDIIDSKRRPLCIVEIPQMFENIDELYMGERFYIRGKLAKAQRVTTAHNCPLFAFFRFARDSTTKFLASIKPVTEKERIERVRETICDVERRYNILPFTGEVVTLMLQTHAVGIFAAFKAAIEATPHNEHLLLRNIDLADEESIVSMPVVQARDIAALMPELSTQNEAIPLPDGIQHVYIFNLTIDATPREFTRCTVAIDNEGWMFPIPLIPNRECATTRKCSPYDLHQFISVRRYSELPDSVTVDNQEGIWFHLHSVMIVDVYHTNSIVINDCGVTVITGWFLASPGYHSFKLYIVLGCNGNHLRLKPGLCFNIFYCKLRPFHHKDEIIFETLPNFSHFSQRRLVILDPSPRELPGPLPHRQFPTDADAETDAAH